MAIIITYNCFEMVEENQSLSNSKTTTSRNLSYIFGGNIQYYVMLKHDIYIANTVVVAITVLRCGRCSGVVECLSPDITLSS